MPASLDDISIEWLGNVLGRPVQRIAVTPMPLGYGILSELARVDADGESLVVKLASRDPVTFYTSVGMTWYQREVALYRDLAHRIACRVPVCRASVVDDDQRFALVLDDLSPSCRPIDQIAGVTDAESFAVIDALAALHGSIHVADLPSWVPLANDPTLAIIGPFCQNIWPAFAANSDWPSEAIAVAEAFVAHLPAVLNVWAHCGPSVLTHGDVRGDNLLMHVATGEAVLLDWQQPAKQPAGWDLAHFALTTLATNDRRRLEPVLLDRYTRARPEVGSDQLWHEYRLAALMLVYKPVANINLDPGTDRGRAMMQSMSDRMAAAIIDLNLADLLAGLLS